MHLHLDGRTGSLWLRDAVNELLGESPYDVLRRDHGGYQIFKLARTLIVGHEPHSDTRSALQHDTLGIGVARQDNVPAFETITNCLPASLWIVIGVYDHSQSQPARHGQLNGDALGELGEPALLVDVKVARQARLGTKMRDDMLIIRPFDEQRTVSGSTRQSHRALPNLYALARGRLEFLFGVLHRAETAIVAL